MHKKLTVYLPINPLDTRKQKRYIANVIVPGAKSYSWCADTHGDKLELYHPETYEIVCTVKYAIRKKPWPYDSPAGIGTTTSTYTQ